MLAPTHASTPTHHILNLLSFTPVQKNDNTLSDLDYQAIKNLILSRPLADNEIVTLFEINDGHISHPEGWTSVFVEAVFTWAGPELKEPKAKLIKELVGNDWTRATHSLMNALQDSQIIAPNWFVQYNDFYVLLNL